MKSIRAFFAITLPKSTQASLKKVLASLQQIIPTQIIRWTALPNLHITLQFLHEIQYAHLLQLIEKIQIELKNTAAFQLELGELEYFPTLKHPRVIALQAGPADILADLANTIGRGIAAANYPVAPGLFRGHLTLGRIARMNSQLYSLEQIQLPSIPKAEISEICLFESKPGKEGSLYIPLQQFRFRTI